MKHVCLGGESRRVSSAAATGHGNRYQFMSKTECQWLELEHGPQLRLREARTGLVWGGENTRSSGWSLENQDKVLGVKHRRREETVEQCLRLVIIALSNKSSRGCSHGKTPKWKKHSIWNTLLLLLVWRVLLSQTDILSRNAFLTSSLPFSPTQSLSEQAWISYWYS